jgi:menaquinone-dependent protoporphyrinogen oxidase
MGNSRSRHMVSCATSIGVSDVQQRWPLLVLPGIAARSASHDAETGQASVRDLGVVIVVRVLVTAASRHDATREIAEAIADGLRKRGVHAETRPIEQIAGLDGFDAVVVGSAIYMGRWLKVAREFVARRATALSSMPVWLFSSGPLGPPDHLIPAGEPADAEQLIDLVQARGHRGFPGRLERASLGFAERAAAMAVHAPDGDSRDWDAIDAFAGEIAAELSAEKATR